MKLVANNVMCTAKNEPRQWEFEDGRKGTTYKVELSDGSGNISIACLDEDIYNKFVPFKFHEIELSLEQTNYEGRKGVKAIVSWAMVQEDEG